MHGMAVGALRFSTMRGMRVGSHLRGAFGYLGIRAMAFQAGLFDGRGELAVSVTGCARKACVRPVSFHRGGCLDRERVRERSGQDQSSCKAFQGLFHRILEKWNKRMGRLFASLIRSYTS